MNVAIPGRRIGMLGPILGAGIILAISGILHPMMRTVPSEAESRLLGTVAVLFIIYWIVADARQRHCVPCFDFGFLLAVFFPVSLIWYAFWTRGRRGILLLLGLTTLIYGPWLCAVIFWVVWSIVR